MVFKDVYYAYLRVYLVIRAVIHVAKFVLVKKNYHLVDSSQGARKFKKVQAKNS